MTDQTVTPQTEEIRQLINSTTVLNDAEKKYWLDLLPKMDEAQMNQLKGILVTEQKNMQAIDQKYDKKLEDVSQKYLNRWDSEKNKAARIARDQEELKHREEEQTKAEELLGRW
jgi:hypothetical protein